MGFSLVLYIFVAASPYWNAPEPIGAYLNGILPEKTPSGSSKTTNYQVENAFPNLTFIDPLAMLELPEKNEFLIAGLQGHIWKFQNSSEVSEKKLLLDLSSNIAGFTDGGLLGIVLHPEFGQTNSPNSEYLYVTYRYTPVKEDRIASPEVNGYLRLSRFHLSLEADQIDPSTEYVMMQIFDRHDYHSAGDMFFGSEGFLYIALGDEGSKENTLATQQIDKWLFSGLLRIDVDKKGGDISHPIRKQPLDIAPPPSGWPSSFTQGYYIPNDNPWLDPNGSILEEFYAIGLRNPHRIFYDRIANEIWIGEVGQGRSEEINIVEKGDNLQWPYMEGNYRRVPRPDSILGREKSPLFSYDRNFGGCIIGGLVYRGSLYPELQGKYIFADFNVHTVHTLQKDSAGGEPVIEFLLSMPNENPRPKDGPASFFADSQGSIYILNLFDTKQDGGTIQKIVRTEETVPDPPSTLSALGIFSDLQTLKTVPGIIPYELNVPFWSDGARKRRWIALANDGNFDTSSEKIFFEEEENWGFPPGTVTIKHFDMPSYERDSLKWIKLETRLMVFTSDRKAYGVTYRWNDEGTEAYLIDINTQEQRELEIQLAGGGSRSQTWTFPARQQCMQCHTAQAAYALGLKTRQLNKLIKHPSNGELINQLSYWSSLGIFRNEMAAPTKLPQLADLKDEQTSLTMRIRSYLDANCANCHQPNGVDAAFDARSATALYDQHIINTLSLSRNSSDSSYIIKPGSIHESEIWLRDASKASNRMPPIGTHLNDVEYLIKLKAWILKLDSFKLTQVDERWYLLKSVNSGQFATVRGASSVNQTPVIVSTRITGDHQKWFFQSLGNHKYRINIGHSNKVMALGSLSPAKGEKIIQEAWSGKQQQMWYIEQTPQGYFKIINAYNHLILGTSNETSNALSTLITIKDDSLNQQAWQLLPTLLNPLRITRLVLMDANTNQEIQDLQPGANVIDLAKVGSDLSIRADVHRKPGSVVFSIDEKRFRTENRSPYALNGNLGQNYIPFPFALGTYAFSITAFEQVNAQGNQGIPFKLDLIVIDENAPKNTLSSDLSEIFVYPNPLNKFEQFLKVDFQNILEGTLSLELVPAYNSELPIRRETLKIDGNQQFVSFDLSGLPSGMYYLYIKGRHKVKMVKVLVRE